MTESCRLVTTEQYKEYLKLKEEHKPLSWEELKEEAKKMGDKIKAENIIGFKKNDLYFNCYKYGSISIADARGNDICVKDRTPDQMLTIMKALQ